MHEIAYINEGPRSVAIAEKTIKECVDMSNEINKAKVLAETMHAGQTYGSEESYSKHLCDVVEILKSYGFTDESLLVAGWLHDIVEDTPMTMEALWNSGDYSAEALNIVLLVTDQPGCNRRERHHRTYPRIAESRSAVSVKLADRIANVRASVAKSDPKLAMYRREYSDFQNFLCKPKYSEHAPMWAELDKLLAEL